MKKAVLVLVAVIVAGLAIVAAGTDWRAGSRQWPLGLGNVDSVPARREDVVINRPIPELDAARKAIRQPGATWSDFRGRWDLSRALWRRWQLVSAMTALSVDQSIVASARDNAQRPPAWFREFRTFDRRKAIVAALQAETWLMSEIMRDYARSDDAGTNWLRRAYDMTIVTPYLEVSRLNYVTYQRKVAEQIASGQCTFDEIPWWNLPAQAATPNMTAICQRLMQIERELTYP